MSDLMREEFEAWWSSTPILGENKRTIAEKAWQASRECLVIELPKPYAVIGDYADCGGGRTVLDAEFSEKITDRMCKKTAVYDKTIFEALGLKVKP